MASTLKFPFKFEPFSSNLSSDFLQTERDQGNTGNLNIRQGTRNSFLLPYLPRVSFVQPVYCPSGSIPALLSPSLSLLYHSYSESLHSEFPNLSKVQSSSSSSLQMLWGHSSLSQLILKLCTPSWLHIFTLVVFCRAHSPHHGRLFARTKRLLSCCAQQGFKAFPHFVGKFLPGLPKIGAAVQTVKPNPRHLTKKAEQMCIQRELLMNGSQTLSPL